VPVIGWSADNRMDGNHDRRLVPNVSKTGRLADNALVVIAKTIT